MPSPREQSLGPLPIFVSSLQLSSRNDPYKCASGVSRQREMMVALLRPPNVKYARQLDYVPMIRLTTFNHLLLA